MSDLDKWYYFVEPAAMGPKGTSATRHIFMKGSHIVKMVRYEDVRYKNATDEETLRDFVDVNWASEALNPGHSLPGWKGDE
jgi:hypothetical protein